MKLEIVQIEKKYKKVQALKGVNFTFEKGIYGLLGPNGSGKSTLMNIVTSNIPASSGKVLWNHQEIRTIGKEYRKILGYVPQQQSLYPDFTVLEFMQYVSVLRDVSVDESETRIEELLKMVELTEERNYKIRMLSGGMKQRLLIAQAMLGDPQLLIMDEPTVGLDPRQRKQILNLIQEISTDKIVIIATHIVSDLNLFSDWVLLMRKGEIIKSGAPTELICEVERYTGEQNVSLDDVYLHYFGEEYEKTNLL